MAWTKCCGLACVMVALGCGVRESRERTVVEWVPLALGERRIAERAIVQARQDDAGVLARARYDSWCEALVRDEMVVEERITRSSRGAQTGAILALSGLGTLLLGVGMNASAPDDPQNSMPGLSPDGLLILVGAGVAVAGVAAMWASDVDVPRETRQERHFGPPRQLSVGACSETHPAPRRVDLVLPDGSVARGEQSATGLWKIEIADAVWRAFGNRFDADVLVDGVPIRRFVLIRRAP